MKKLDYNHLTTGALTVDASHLIGVVNDLIDLVNSQQEAIEKLESKVWTAGFIEKYRPALENLARADDKPVSCRKCMTNTHIELCCPKSYTHRTVTLRIPKDKTVAEALWEAFANSISSHTPPVEMSDTDLQAAIDKINEEKE